MSTVHLCQSPPQTPTPAALSPNGARNHHYIAQTEQRQHAFNPEVNANNQNVYRHAKQADSGQHSLGQSVNIDHNLSAQDLYTLAELGDGQQYNLEPWFVRYEGRYESDCAVVKQLTVGQQTMPVELVRVLKLKWLSLLRNPLNQQHFIVKQLSLSWQQGLTVFAQNLEPHIHERDDAARQQLAKQFGLTNQAYVSWLSFIYALLSDAVATPSWFERISDLLVCHPAVRVECFQDNEQRFQTVFADTGFALQAAHDCISLGFSIDPHHWVVCHIPQAHWESMASCWCATPSVHAEPICHVRAADAAQAQVFNALMFKSAERAVCAQAQQRSALS